MNGLNTAQIIDRARQQGVTLSDQQAQQILSQAYSPNLYGADPSKVDSLIGGGSSASGGTGKVPTAEDIVGASQAKLKEQVTFLKDFLAKNPLAFDETLARQMAQDKYKPYYQEVLNDFVQPLQDKISRSSTDQSALIGELVRQQQSGSRDIQKATQTAIDKSREGFAGTGLLGSGIESGNTARQNITGTNQLTDFNAANTFQQNQTNTQQERVRADANTAITKENRDVFGPGRQFDTAVTQDVEGQRGTALKQRGLSTIDAISSQFGSPLPDIPNYLNLYNA